MCNVTVFQVDLSEVEGVRAGPDRTGLVPVWPGAFYLGAQGLLPVWLGRVVRGLLLREEDLGRPQLFQVSVTVCH